jgi:nucleotide-binding universal stress UspA family protein
MGREWLLGSAAERIAQHSPVPVLIVRQPELLLKWIRGERALQALVCADLTPASRAALRWARDLHRVGVADLELVHVAWPPEEPPSLVSAASPPPSPSWTALEESLVNDLKVWAAGTGVAAAQESYRAVINWGRTDAAITAHAAATRSALIIAGTHRRSRVARLWEGSVSRALLHHADTNVACVPPAPVPTGDIVDIKRVLAAVDLSELDLEVVRTALGVAPQDSEVHVLHVLEERANQETEQHALQQLGALLARMPRPANVATEITVRRGDSPHAVIAEHAERMAADAICMGTQRRNRAMELLLGSQTRGVLERAHVPVILVPPLEVADRAT